MLDGHREGAQALKRTVKDAVRHDLDELTVFAFSTENWSRPKDEVDGLMAMFAELIRSETPELKEQGVQHAVHRSPRGPQRRAARHDGLGDRRDGRAATA